MAQFLNMYSVDLQKPTGPQPLRQMVCAGDNAANRIGAIVTSDGGTVSLGGSCVGKVVRADGTTVQLSGTISGNQAYVVLDQASCAIAGQIQVAVCWVSGSNVTTLVIAYGSVVSTQTGSPVQPSTPIPDLTQLLAEIENMRTATAAATAAATGALANFAGAFSETAVYTAGQYVTYTDGKFYRLTADHAANVTWANTSKVAVTTGGELSGLKQAIATENANIMANFAGAFIQATAYPAGTYVTYTDGNMYILPSGHEANATWANTAKTQVSVGGELSELKSALTGIESVEKIIDLDVSETATTFISIPVSLKAGSYLWSITSIVSSDTVSNVSRYEFRDSDNNIVYYNYSSRTPFTDQSFVLTDNVASLYFYASNNYSNSEGKTITVNNMIIKHDYPLKNQIDQLADGLADTNTDLANYQNAISEYVTPVNLYNKNSSLNKTDKIINSSWLLETLNGSSVTHPIPCKNGDIFCFKWYESYYGTTANARVMKCNNDGTSLGIGINATGANQNAYGYFTVSWDGYFCVNVRSSEIGSMIVAKGSDLPTYSDYFEPFWKILESALPSMPLPVNAEYNPLYGKKAAFTGDSICYGAGAAGGYPAIIGTNNVMIVSNTGQTGATLATGTTVDGVNRGWICNKVANMPDDYDYYIVEGGVNDAALNVQLGTITSGYTATFDTTTICGAMEQICKTLQTTFVGKKYGFIFPHNCYGDTSAWNTGWRDTMKQCLKKWGIPYLDLSDECAQLRNIDALRVYTANSDGWHPTEDGYKIYYVPKIEAWMKTL